MNWIFIAIIGYLLLAAVNIIDKVLLSKYVTNSFVYTFFVGILGLVAFVLAPFGLYLPDAFMLAISLIGGGFFILALLLLFYALREGEASRVVPFTGGLIPLFIFVFSYLFLGERLGFKEIIAFFILITGGIIITIMPGASKKWVLKNFFIMISASLAFAISYVMSKYVYNELGFITGFVWLRVGSFIGALFILFSKSVRKDIKKIWYKIKVKGKLYYLGNQAFGGMGFFFINYAISLASVSLVNALQGMQYVFVMVIAFIVSRFKPELMPEKISKNIIIQKVFAIVLIVLGIYLLYI